MAWLNTVLACFAADGPVLSRTAVRNRAANTNGQLTHPQRPHTGQDVKPERIVVTGQCRLSLVLLLELLEPEPTQVRDDGKVDQSGQDRPNPADRSLFLLEFRGPSPGPPQSAGGDRTDRTSQATVLVRFACRGSPLQGTDPHSTRPPGTPAMRHVASANHLVSHSERRTLCASEPEVSAWRRGHGWTRRRSVEWT